ncbi:MAG: NERD domain-containing protein [Bacteroidales bacterium]|nr:NERD domain-containing protein [Bacteroidales bacterium]
MRDLNSLNEVLAFRNDFMSTKNAIISRHFELIAKEKVALKDEILSIENQIDATKIELENTLQKELEDLNQQLSTLNITTSFSIKNILNYFKIYTLKRKINDLETHFDLIIEKGLFKTSILLQQKKNRINFIVTDFEEAVNQSSATELKELNRKIKIIDEIMPSILGAVGESKVEKEMQFLPDGYYLINDFVLTFKKPLYYKEENSYIKSIQIDHLLVCSAGVFIIETKNWSAQSLANADLRSPVQQIIRSSYALNRVIHNHASYLFSHHWGKRKISLRNLIVFINQKPIEEFEYVKLLTLNKLRGYIEYFKPGMTIDETESLVKYLLSINESLDIK